MTTLEQAYASYRQWLTALPAEAVPVEAALSRVAGETVRAAIDTPRDYDDGPDGHSRLPAEVVPAAVRPMAAKKGKALARPGRRLGTDKLREFIDAGLDLVRVSRRPCIRILLEDAPYRSADGPSPGKMHRSRGAMIVAMLRKWGYEASGAGSFAAEPGLIRRDLDVALLQADLVIAASSAGEGHDALLAAARECGMTLVFKGVEHAPGRSIAFAARGNRALLVLPASPAAMLVGMSLHVRYILDCLEGQLPAGPAWSPGVLASAIAASSDVARFLLMRLYINEAGVTRLFAAQDEADADIDPIALREVIAWVPAGEHAVPVGSILYWTELNR